MVSQLPRTDYVSMTDRTTVSIEKPLGTEYPLGFNTENRTLNALKRYVVNTLSTDITQILKIKAGGGLSNTGSSNNPLSVDKSWFDKTYFKREYFPVSQVASPNDFSLPIAGSYFSVSYPYANVPHPAMGFLEGNGELRILRHVTNGETVRPVYGLWSNYRNTDVSNLRFTDIPYSPPGLNAGEYIRMCYTNSTSAMVAEIWNAQGFREHAFIRLNGTFNHANHTLIRLGNQIITTLTGNGTVSNAKLNEIRVNGVSAVVSNGKMYVAIAPRSWDSFAVGETVILAAEVSTSGSLSMLRGWNTTNPFGWTSYNNDGAQLFNRMTTTVEGDKDAVYQQVGNYPEIRNILKRMIIVGTTSNGKVLATFHRVDQWFNAGIDMAARPIYYLEIDFAARTMKPADNSITSRIVLRRNGNDFETLHPMKVYDYNGWGAVLTMLQILGDGTRLFQVYTDGTFDLIPRLDFIKNDVVKKLADGVNDSFFERERIQHIDNATQVTPTVVPSTRRSHLMFDKLILQNILEAGGVADSSVQKTYAVLKGASNAATYNLLSSDVNAQGTSVKGFALNADRGICPSDIRSLHSFFRNGNVGYHGAQWGKTIPATATFHASYRNDMTVFGTYRCNQAVWDALNSWALSGAGLPIPNGYNRVANVDWSMVPPMPGLSPDLCVVYLLINWEKTTVEADDGEGFVNPETGFRSSAMYMVQALVPCGYGRDSANGNVTLTSVVTSQAAMYTGRTLGATRSYSLDVGRFSTAQQWHSNNALTIGRWGGVGVNRFNGAGDSGCVETTFYYWSSLTTPVRANTVGAYHAMPVTHPELGIGFSTVTGNGMGAVYSFQGIDMTQAGQGTWGTDARRVLGSSRPPAGFAFTISSPIPVYVSGRQYNIPVGVFDLTSVKANAGNSTFYAHAKINDVNGTTAQLVVTTTPVTDNTTTIHVSTIKTSETEIVSIESNPITRWQNKRPSTKLIGAAIPVSTGNLDVDSGVAWNYDTPAYITNAYWSSNSNGASDPVTTIDSGATVYLIIDVKSANQSTRCDIDWVGTTATVKEIYSGAVSSIVSLGVYWYNPSTKTWRTSYRVVTKAENGNGAVGINPNTLTGAVRLEQDLVIRGVGEFTVTGKDAAIAQYGSFTLTYAVVKALGFKFYLNGRELPLSKGLQWPALNLNDYIVEGVNRITVSDGSLTQPGILRIRAPFIPQT